MYYSVIIPAHNEEKNLKKLIPKVMHVMGKLKKSFEVLVINDKSTDNTTKLILELQKTYKQVVLINRTKNPGVGRAKRLGLAKSKGNVIITLDGDGSHDPTSIPALLKELDHADMVIGSRYIKQGKADMSLSRTLISGCFNLVFKGLFGLRVNDFTSGYKVYKKHVLEQYTSTSFGIYIEIPLRAHLKKCRLVEVPITYKKREHGVSKLNYLKQGPEYLRVVLILFLKRLHLI